ncbi:YaaC family protein [Halobacillus salinus]|uniref:YaaC family protein n=1 Tax=Halobacillus salinus TaxID=192814 RepID=A0A4Z0GXH1_9BACI|nr:YaaC family protein [Halobacillus salinus]TGB01288.1 hypothetical protein E4663_17600 [Halobacillus salinus]
MNESTILTYLQVTSHTRPFLKKCYDKQEHPKSDHHAYQNAERFIHGLILGEDFWKAAASTSLSVQPLLYYYGLNHMIKSCLLTVDPGYPATAKVLAHGLSTRKRKKQHYRFLEDDIRIQPHGLFPYASWHLFGFQSAQEKISMDELLRPLPTMQDLYGLKGTSFSKTEEEWPALMTYFAVLYNLSMLVRYEGEWWGEMQQMRDRDDYVFIVHFLRSAAVEIPTLVSSWLENQFTSLPE